MARSWITTSRGIAKKVKNANLSEGYQLNELVADAKLECPKCNHIIDNNNVNCDWPGFPAGVKFDPSDAELLQHLAGKTGLGNCKSHLLLDEFIPTIEHDEGICYTHPENLPGVKKDGGSFHFFYRTSNAYETGNRKRRKINKCDTSDERVRWHKTGKTKPLLVDGVLKGWKKIMVLYKSSQKGRKIDKAHWVMHQYHLGEEEEEKDGELVVSKIFYQLQGNHKCAVSSVHEECDSFATRVSPRTPNTTTPDPRRPEKSFSIDLDEHKPPLFPGKDEDEFPAWWAGESEARKEPDSNEPQESLLYSEMIKSFPSVGAAAPCHLICRSPDLSQNDILPVANSTTDDFIDLDDILLDTPLADLQFGSQDSMGWLDKF